MDTDYEWGAWLLHCSASGQRREAALPQVGKPQIVDHLGRNTLADLGGTNCSGLSRCAYSLYSLYAIQSLIRDIRVVLLYFGVGAARRLARDFDECEAQDVQYETGESSLHGVAMAFTYTAVQQLLFRAPAILLD